MTRLAATLACDLRLQHRNGFYVAVGLLVAFWVLLALRLPALDWALLLPPVVLNNLLVTTYFFVGGLVLLEKAEGSLHARLVTPLRRGEYLAAKLITLGALGLVESVVVVAAVLGRGFAPLPLTAGALLAGTLLGLLGFVVVSRYDSINEYLMPSVGITSLALLPILPYFGIAASPLWYLHPMQAPLLLLRAAVEPIAGWQLAYGLVYSALSIGVLWRTAVRSFTSLAAGTGAAE